MRKSSSIRHATPTTRPPIRSTRSAVARAVPPVAECPTDDVSEGRGSLRGVEVPESGGQALVYVEHLHQSAAGSGEREGQDPEGAIPAVQGLALKRTRHLGQVVQTDETGRIPSLF